MRFFLVFILIVSGFLSCVEEIKDYQFPKVESVITFEGGISNIKEKHSITLYRTSNDPADFTKKSPISNAKIYVMDENKTKIDYTEVTDGFYQTNATIQGRIGGKYQLFMEIEGKKFESTIETMPDFTPIDKLYAEPTLKDNLPTTSSNRTGFDIFLDFKDAAKEGQFYRWTWKNFAKVRYCSQCKVEWDDKKNACDETNASRFAMRINHICRSTCFDVKYSDNLNLFSDALSNGKDVKRIYITRVPNMFDEYHLPFDKYFYEIEQRSLTKNAYLHYKLLQEQAEQSGTLFDVPALTKFNINIKPMENEEKVVGIFEVYSANKKTITVKIGEVIQNEEPKYNRLLQALDCHPNPCTAPCIESIYRTKTVPDGWIE